MNDNHWAIHHRERRDRRARNREYSLKLLHKMGYDVTSYATGNVSFEYHGRTVHFSPATGAWCVRSTYNVSGRGVHNLINYLTTGVNNTRR